MQLIGVSSRCEAVSAQPIHLLNPTFTMKLCNSLLCFALLAGLCSVATRAQAQIMIISPGSSWEYTRNTPTADPSWTTSSGGWSVGLAPFGNDFGHGYDANFYPVTRWDANTDIWVRKTINLTGFNLSAINWGLGADNAYTLFLNGTQVSSGDAEGYTSRWEYSGVFNSALLNPGTNYIAVALHDRGGMTAFDMQVTGRLTPVPEPATYGFMGAAGLAGLAFWRRRRARR